LKYNGGKPEPDNFYFKGKKDSGIVDVFFSIFDEEDLPVNNLGWNSGVYSERIPDGFLPIASVSGGDLVCISTKGKNEGKVFFWEHEGESDNKPTYKNITLIADSFNKFINYFHYPDYEIEFERLCRAGRIEEIKMQLENGLDPNTKDGMGKSLLELALEYNLIDIMKILLDKGANNSGVLHWAGSGNKIQEMNLLISYGADVNEFLESKPGGTPLSRSIYFGRVEAVKFLIENGANVKFRNKQGYSTIQSARMFNYASKEIYEEIIEILKKAGAEE
jgi:ankyrin repeat protein